CPYRLAQKAIDDKLARQLEHCYACFRWLPALGAAPPPLRMESSREPKSPPCGRFWVLAAPPSRPPSRPPRPPSGMGSPLAGTDCPSKPPAPLPPSGALRIELITSAPLLGAPWPG